jgi:hypothetical protein
LRHALLLVFVLWLLHHALLLVFANRGGGRGAVHEAELEAAALALGVEVPLGLRCHGLQGRNLSL